MSERQHDIAVIYPVALVFPVMQSDTQQQSHSFFAGVFCVWWCLLGVGFFFNVLILTSSKVDNSPAVNVIIKSGGKQSRGISPRINLSKCFCAN